MNNYKQLKDKLQKEIEQIKQILAIDGGDIEIISFKNNNLKLRFKGNCVNCPSMYLTFKSCVEKELRDKIPELQQIELIK